VHFCLSVSLEVFGIEGVWQFFQWAGRTFCLWSAEFFAESYQERVVLIEELRILRQVRLEQFS
jgi:hypothetical protein